MAGSLTVTGLSTGENAGERVIGPLSVVGSTVIGESLCVPLASGDNTFAVPAGAVAALILPGSGTVATLKVRTNTNSADGGLVLSSSAVPFVYPFPSTAPTSLIINAASAVSSSLTIAFI